MDIFERLGNFIDSLVTGESSETDFRDPDVREAWEELDTYMKNDPEGGRATAEDRDSRTGQGVPPNRRDQLRRAFATLEIPYGASLAQARKAYKSLLVRYHPDRHAHDPVKLEMATELTQQISAAFETIETYYEGRN